MESFRALALVLWPIAACRMQACWTSLAVVAFCRWVINCMLFCRRGSKLCVLHERIHFGSRAGASGSEMCLIRGVTQC